MAGHHGAVLEGFHRRDAGNAITDGQILILIYVHLRQPETTLAFLCQAYCEDEAPDENGKPTKASSIARLDKDLMWQVDHKDKSYTEMTFAQMRAMMDSLKKLTTRLKIHVRNLYEIQLQELIADYAKEAKKSKEIPLNDDVHMLSDLYAQAKPDVLRAARSRGGAFAELYVEERSSVAIRLDDGKVEELTGMVKGVLGPLMGEMLR